MKKAIFIALLAIMAMGAKAQTKADSVKVAAAMANDPKAQGIRPKTVTITLTLQECDALIAGAAGGTDAFLRSAHVQYGDPADNAAKWYQNLVMQLIAIRNKANNKSSSAPSPLERAGGEANKK